MNAIHLLPVVLSPVLLLAAPQEVPRDQERNLEPIVARLRSTDAATSGQAWQELEELREVAYPALFAAWEGEPEGRSRKALGHLLFLPELRAATVVFRGTLEELRHDQGGVVDIHWLRATVADAALLRGDADVRALFAQGGMVDFLRGTSQDWWLADLMRRDLERVAGPRLWILRPRLREYDYSDTARTSVLVMEYTTLPAAAAEVVAAWLGEQD